VYYRFLYELSHNLLDLTIINSKKNIQPDPRFSLVNVVEGTAFAAHQQHVRNFRQAPGPDDVCQAVRAVLEEA
jgi:hypothetical protein